MFEVLIKTLITFSVIYTLINGFLFLIKLIFTDDKPSVSCVVIEVCNQEKNIENVIRSLIFKYLSVAGGSHIPDIVIIDKGSDDLTPQICKRLSRDYSFVYFYEKDEDIIGV